MKMRNLAVFGALFAGSALGTIEVSNLESGEDIMSDTTCIQLMSEAVSDVTNYDDVYREQIRKDSDSGMFHLMGLSEKEYSLPYSMKVCYTWYRITGVQLTLGMHRIPFEGEDIIVEKFGAQAYLDELDDMIARTPPRRMKMIGGQAIEEGIDPHEHHHDLGNTCETVRFARGDKVPWLGEITVGHDETGVRSLQLVVMHDKEHTDKEVLNFGYELPVQDKSVYYFDHGVPLLGMFGRVFFDPLGVQPERLISLDFYTNHCARTQQLFFTAKVNAEIEIQEWTFMGREDSSGAEIFGAIIIIYMIIITFILCYCMIRNRKLILSSIKNKGPAEGANTSGFNVPEADVTPANIPRQPDELDNS